MIHFKVLQKTKIGNIVKSKKFMGIINGKLNKTEMHIAQIIILKSL